MGNNKPINEKYLEQYQLSKAESNVKRAIDRKLRRKYHSKNLLPNINYRPSKKKDGTFCSEGYFIQIKINDKLNNKAFFL